MILQATYQSPTVSGLRRDRVNYAPTAFLAASRSRAAKAVFSCSTARPTHASGLAVTRARFLLGTLYSMRQRVSGVSVSFFHEPIPTVRNYRMTRCSHTFRWYNPRPASGNIENSRLALVRIDAGTWNWEISGLKDAVFSLFARFLGVFGLQIRQQPIK